MIEPGPLRTTVYVDGLNLYFGCLKDTPFRWLNVAELCRRSLPAACSLTHIHYFTGRISSNGRDPEGAANQQTFLRALATLPNLTVYCGETTESVRRRPLAFPVAGLPSYVDVLERQERGTDVHLSTLLLRDAHRNAFDVAVVISDDSDLVRPIEVVRRDHEKPVQVLSPRGRAHHLAGAATHFQPIDPQHLRDSQFPPLLADAAGPFHRPNGW